MMIDLMAESSCSDNAPWVRTVPPICRTAACDQLVIERIADAIARAAPSSGAADQSTHSNRACPFMSSASRRAEVPL
jgi:hypothetical protein